ncbi:MAG: GNAT family N-acetyltransferase [Deltaproteobacteria bacterium]|nr:GNAT family N-acetyltransferase [Deltaproteobacteria bacterium]
MPHLRPFEPRDYQHFVALDLDTEADALGEITDAERALFRTRWPAMLAMRGVSQAGFVAPGAQLFILEGDDNSFLGHLWLTEKVDGLGQRVLEVTTMGLVREARGQGLGRLLMNKAETEAQAKGIGHIELSVAGNNRRARDLYRDLGYDTVRRTMRKKLRQ